MNTNNATRDECIAEIERELKMRVQVWSQTRPVDPQTGPTFRDPKHQIQYNRMTVILSVIKSMTPEQFVEFKKLPAYEPPTQNTLF